MPDTKPREHYELNLSWNSERPHILVVACSDGRLQVATDEFLSRHLGIQHYDRLYAPGGAGALSASGRDFLRAPTVQQECLFLVEAHQVEILILLYHGPAPNGPTEACCADYRRKLPSVSDAQLREQQEKDARELLKERWKWAGKARVSIYRCEVMANGSLDFVTLHQDK